MLRFLQASLFGICLASALRINTATAFYVGGDAIGLDNSTTYNIGGFTSVQIGALNLGQPAILVSLGGHELLTELRVIVFGLADGGAGPNFNDFQYRLDVWPAAEYFANLPPTYHVELGPPIGIQNIATGPTSVVPALSFGNAGIAGNNALTYDFRFDLTATTAGGASSNIFASPLVAGDWVFGFQSWHDPAASGYLRVSGSIASTGPIPLFSRDSTPRGVLGGQDPGKIGIRWGISLAAVTETSPGNLAGDYNGDAMVDAADYTVWRAGQAQVADVTAFELWRRNFGSTLPVSAAGDFNSDGRIDGADYVIWRDQLGSATEAPLAYAGDGLNGVDEADYWVWRQYFNASAIGRGNGFASLPEPSVLIQMTGGAIVLVRRRRRELKPRHYAKVVGYRKSAMYRNRGNLLLGHRRTSRPARVPDWL